MSRRHFGLAILALATGGFAIGTTEFVTMGLLPQIAAGVSVSIPDAGHLISVYALGVVIGAPLIGVLGSHLPRRGVLVALMAALALGNAATALAGSYGALLVARFVSGLPHGAYFGVASLVAASMARAGRKGRAVALVMLGLSVANVAGVPAATWLGQQLGWRSAYWLVAVLAVLTLAAVLVTVPAVPGDSGASGRRELTAFARPQVWLTLLIGAVGFGGMFAVYSYITPVLTEVGDLPEAVVPVFMAVYGLGMVAGTWLGGLLTDWSVLRALAIGAAGMLGSLLLFWVSVPAGWASLPALFAISVLASVLVVGLQLRLMQVAGEAQTLGAALNHASLNLANALGAWLGGIVIAAGWGFRAPALVGAGLAVVGLVLVGSAGLLQARQRTVQR